MSTQCPREKKKIGPADKRRQTKRCGSCSARRIKCEGGFPCTHCIKKGNVCTPPKQTTGTLLFVEGHVSGVTKYRPTTLNTRSSEWTTSIVSSSPTDGDPTVRFIGCFLLFIQQNQFTPGLQSLDTEILQLVRTSPVLHHSAVAIGALDASRQGSVSVSSGQDSPQYVAFNSYLASIRALQASVSDKDAAQGDDVLWGTFFLGLFELLSDSSGDGWVKHMLYGTSMLLQLSSPDKNMSSLRRTFYGIFRMLEASRALLYGEATILADSTWENFHRELVSDDESWDPIEGILALMIHCSTFSLRAHQVVFQLPEAQRYTDPAVSALGLEGLTIQNAIYAWHAQALSLLSTSDSSPLLLALAYYNALLIFLSGNFDYFPYWTGLSAPILSRPEIMGHVASILQLTDVALRTSRLAGALMFFPLRVAGSRAGGGEQRGKILEMLSRVAQKGFVVAGRIRDDLREVWDERGMFANGEGCVVDAS
ncbi:uncharacterized protein BP5553_09209 [Venustampulla echinocandica]|uniref:Zn(2)-C6 fungal-type domain-containing protein n=1 Tax=Venustampulla echinocandica TaxID=2656787 RepID=A0A370TC32_9HELO|nr:uncharacterized protein BP5553_09209 [Venustampulla echinocandica]RDL31807.1 hypothetical protein BP5553_09209 [Venustampulla echinocandica]